MKILVCLWMPVPPLPSLPNRFRRRPPLLPGYFWANVFTYPDWRGYIRLSRELASS